MSGNKKKYFSGLFSMALLGISLGCSAQSSKESSSAKIGEDSSVAKKRGEYSLLVYAGGGISFYTGRSGEPEGFSNEVNRTAFAGTLRVMWQPDHLLSVGFETGWTQFYSYSTQQGSLTSHTDVTAVPLLVVFSMPVVKRVHVFTGVGGYLVSTKLNYLEETSSSTLSLGWMAAANYVYPLNKKFSIAGEIKYANAYENEDANISVQLQLVWTLTTW
jgi:hypothetical protein